MIVLYNLVIILTIALITKLGIKYTDYEEYFVTLGVLDIIHFICLLFYVLCNTNEITINF